MKINDVAKSATGALDPECFWLAWAWGRRMAVDILAADWDFWAWTGEALADLQARHVG